MTKRYQQFENVQSKRAKIEENIDELWGDDFDEDDCIRIATQIEERTICTQDRNVSHLPNYDVFKAPTTLFSSTQLNAVSIASSSKTVLQEKYDEKVGEVAVLRSQLQEAKEKHMLEQQKRQEEWKQKLNASQKQMNSIKGELEFKNLEIANLKLKILDISKFSAENCSNSVRKVKLKPEANICNKFEPILNPDYPLKHLECSCLFTNFKENYWIQEKLNKNKEVTNQISSNFKPKFDIKTENVSQIYNEMSELICSTVEEINSDKSCKKIDKILNFSIQHLLELENYLKTLETVLNVEDIHKADSKYLSESNCFNCDINQLFLDDEFGVKAGIVLLFLSELLPYSDYFKTYLFHNKEDFVYLNVVLNVVTMCGKLRKSKEMSGFLYSVVNLLSTICISGNYDYVCFHVNQLTKEVLFSRPTSLVFYKMSMLLKYCSSNSNFIEFLFKKANSSVTVKYNRGILYYNEDSCIFYVFVAMFVKVLLKVEPENFPLEICVNLLSFVYNTFNSSLWLHHQDKNQCECVSQMYKLEIDLVFKAIGIYNETRRNGCITTDDWNEFLNHKITTKVLTLMISNAYELTEKYVSVYSQFKAIQQEFKKVQLDDLENSAIPEEIAEIHRNSSVFNYF